MRVRMAIRHGQSKLPPQLRLLTGKRRVGDAALRQKEGVLVPPRKEAADEQVQRRGERLAREEGAARVHRVVVVPPAG